MSVRSWLREALEVPSDWVWITEQRMPDTISKTTVVTKHARIEPLVEGGPGVLRHEVVLSVFAPSTTPKAAEDVLDDAVTELITALDGHDRIRFNTAEKVISPNEKYFGWDITLSVITNPEPEEA